MLLYALCALLRGALLAPIRTLRVRGRSARLLAGLGLGGETSPEALRKGLRAR